MITTAEATLLERANFIVGTVGAFGTILALVVAIVLGLHESRRWRAEASERDKDRRAHEEAQERTQAEQINAVAVADREPQQQVSLRGRQLPDEHVHYAYADVINASGQPIYGAKVLIPHGEGVIGIRVGFVPGGGDRAWPEWDDRPPSGRSHGNALRAEA